jgi:hypothetical protein
MSTLQVFISIVAILVFLYFFWRRLKEDYSSEIIFTSGFLILAGMGLGYFSFNYLIAPSFSANNFFNPLVLGFWGGFWGLWLGLLVSILKYKTRFFETLESALVAVLASLVPLSLLFFLESQDLIFLAAIVVTVLLLTAFFVLDRHYKKFAWYRSGRVGFSGLSITGMFFLIRATTALFLTDKPFFVGRLDVILSSIAAFFFFLLVFNLSRKK